MSYSYWDLLTPSWDPPFQVQVMYRRLTLIRETVGVKKAELWLLEDFPCNILYIREL